MKKPTILAAMFLVAGCQTTPEYPEVRLADLMLRDGGKTVRYMDAVWALPQAKWWMKGLPLPAREMYIASLPEAARWMSAYNFDRNERLSKGEMTQAWLVKHAEWKTGNAYAPDSLSSFARTASRVLIVQAPSSLTGVALSTDDERSVRASIDALGGHGMSDATQAQKAISGMVSSINASVSSSGGGGDGGGGSDGGGSDGGGASGGTGGSGSK